VTHEKILIIDLTNLTTMKSNEILKDYLQGNKLYGDDFTDAEIEAWVRDESTGYESLVSDSNYSYKITSRY
jgi:hypothetical protein